MEFRKFEVFKTNNCVNVKSPFEKEWEQKYTMIH